jgi:putative ABC transport system substrate-binding protein
LAQGGFVDGQNVTIQYRWAGGQYQNLPTFAAELIGLRVAAIVAGGDPAALAAKAAANAVPVVFLIGDDPVRLGLAASLNRPGGNATGVSLISNALGAKRLELLCGLLPNDSTVALLINSNSPNASAHAQEVGTAARTLGRKLLVLRASTEADIQSSFATLAAEGVHALVVHNDPFFDTRRDVLVALSAAQGVAAIFHIREFPAAGGLMSYGPSLTSSYRDLGMQTGRVLQGTSPSDVPVVQPTKFELVINLKTVKALGLIVSPSVLATADDVIE